MKLYSAILVTAFFLVSCQQIVNKNENKGDTAFVYAEPGQSTKADTQQSPFQSYGAKISPEGAVKSTEINEQYASLKAGDTAVVKFEAPINAVCKSKGCWMRLDAGEEEVFVKFKEYGFFVPLDATGDAVVQGKAYLEEVTVDELRHMAKDGGKTASEIAAITTPQRELRFMADGVLIKSN